MKEDKISKYANIADGLAETGYSISENFLDDQQVDGILSAPEFREERERYKKAGTGTSKNINEGVRGDLIQWINRQSVSGDIGVYLSMLDELRTYLNRALFLSLKDLELHTTIYPAGAFYKRHLDQFKASDRRKLSVICYLNKGWLPEYGGQLRMFLPDSAQDVFPVAGRLVCFRSDLIEHEVIPSSRERLSLTGWMLDSMADFHTL